MCGLVCTQQVRCHVKGEMLRESKTTSDSWYLLTSLVKDLTHTHTPRDFALEMQHISVWWHLWPGVTLHQLFSKLLQTDLHLWLGVQNRTVQLVPRRTCFKEVSKHSPAPAHMTSSHINTNFLVINAIISLFYAEFTSSYEHISCLQNAVKV